MENVMEKLEFSQFLLNENKTYLGEKVGDILNAVHDLEEDGLKLGARQLMDFSEKVVSLIRRILHSSWPQSEHKYLKSLQKVGVALSKAIEEKGDLKELIPSVRQELEQLSGKLGTPINTMGSPEGAEQRPEQSGPGEPGQLPQQPQQQGGEMGGLPPAGEMGAPGMGGMPPAPGGMPPGI
jgi:hypothetical protein